MSGSLDKESSVWPMIKALKPPGFHCGSQMVSIWEAGRVQFLGSQSLTVHWTPSGSCHACSVDSGCPVLQGPFTPGFHYNASRSLVVTTYAGPPCHPKDTEEASVRDWKWETWAMSSVEPCRQVSHTLGTAAPGRRGRMSHQWLLRICENVAWFPK